MFLGLILEKKFKREELNLGRGISITALSFIIFSILGAIPLGFAMNNVPVHQKILDSFFESVSGLTTTGLSIFKTVETLPKSTLFWRSELQWLGGMGIILIFLSIFRGLPTSSLALYQAQGFTEKIEPSIKHTTQVLLKIYVIYTLLGIGLLYLAGLNAFESVNIAFTSISTGGFAVTDNFYNDNIPALAVISILMILGSINFILHDKLFKRKFGDFIQNIEVKSFFIFLAVIIAIAYLKTGDLKISIFHMVSAITATGFVITDLSKIGEVVLLVTIIAMTIGSFAGSTAGGIKQLRFIISLKSVFWMVKKFTSPNKAIIPFKLGNMIIDDETVKVTQIFITTYLGILVAGSLVLSFLGYSISDSMFQIASAEGTAGLNSVPIYNMPALGKITLIIAMFLGRLEIFPVLILIRKAIEKKR